MISEEKQAELLWKQIEAGREFIAHQIRARFYLIGATFGFAFLLLLPADVPLSLLKAVATKYDVTGVQPPVELLSTLIWFSWSTSVLQACSRSIVISREARHLRVIESRLLPLAGQLVTRFSDFATQRLSFLRYVEMAYMAAFSGASLLVGGYRLVREWGQVGWNPVFSSADTLLFAGTVTLLGLAMRDLARV